MEDKLEFDETELNFILESLQRFKQDIDMWGYIVPKGKTQVNLTHEYKTAIDALVAKIGEHLDGESRD